ncbi:MULTISPECIES: ketosynthase chain-length factor [unclassified Streptomyces]|uniref:ketosynthase chain-length factor n=1 Tax=unclassified Streptomyces TaxID=2593676 RepID=UPI00368BD483
MSPTTVVTGIGITAPTGLGTTHHWDATRTGHNAIAPATRFDPTTYPAQLAGEITHFTAEDHLPGPLLAQTDRVTRLALLAADWALADAGITPTHLNAYDMGVVTASSSGGFEFGQNELRALWSKGSRHVSAYQAFAWFYAVNTGQISIRHGMKGPSGVVVSDQAGGLDALAQARRHIRKGTPLILSGGLDASLCPWGWVAQLTSERLSTSHDPHRAYLPFDAAAHGHVPGEGGALLTLEDAHTATQRGAHIYGEISGYGATFDPAPTSGRPPTLRTAIELALKDAQMTPTDIDVIFADAAALPELDRIETQAITDVFGAHTTPVTAPKTMTGRLNSGAAPLDVATALLALRDQLIPPTINVTPDPTHTIDLVTHPRPAHLRTAMILARGHGGFNSALIVHTDHPHPHPHPPTTPADPREAHT